MLFCGLDLHAPVPDETTHCRFRNALLRGGVYNDLLAEVCRQIEAHGLKLKGAEAAIIDATLIESAARSRTHIAALQDRAESVSPARIRRGLLTMSTPPPPIALKAPSSAP